MRDVPVNIEWVPDPNCVQLSAAMILVALVIAGILVSTKPPASRRGPWDKK